MGNAGLMDFVAWSPMAGVIIVLAISAVAFGVFLALRGVMLWYFRIGEIVQVLKEISQELRNK